MRLAMKTETTQDTVTKPTRFLKRRGLMLVLASPPGGGKTSISREVIRRDAHTTVSVSATTRKQRPGEEEGKHYFFVNRERFEQMVSAGDMLEYALVYNGQMYGTPRAPVEAALAEGNDVLFDVDWQGNRSLSATAHDDVVSIFILPPTWETLEERLHARAQDSEEEIRRRMAKARDEIKHYKEFQYIIVNYDFEESVQRVLAILEGERLKRTRLTNIEAFVETLHPTKYLP
jgi:guanylate kinase